MSVFSRLNVKPFSLGFVAKVPIPSLPERTITYACIQITTESGDVYSLPIPDGLVEMTVANREQILFIDGLARNVDDLVDERGVMR